MNHNVVPSAILLFLLFFLHLLHAKSDSATVVGLYKTFETSIQNNRTYANKFSDVELICTFTSPTNKTYPFYGFFDGDGNGGGDKQVGNVWKIRFLPNEIGKWTYTWQWSDNSQGGSGIFICDSVNAGKGVLQAFKQNPRWFAYNGDEPVWLKSYYETGHGSLAQPFEWITKNVYLPMINQGYNHLQVNWLLSLCCFTQIYNDGPATFTKDLALYEDGKVLETMRLDVWKLMEKHVAWLNDRNIGLHMFLGFDASKNEGPAWKYLSAEEKDFYVKYVVSRLAPYANIAGWGYTWEVPGDRPDEELGWAKLVKRYDVFNHLRTYEDEHPVANEFHRPEYTFAAIENHSIYSTNRDEDRPYWKEAWTHHEACLAGYVTGKPVYMIEGNALWRRFWQKRTNASLDDLRQSAWACATAGASFNWCGHAGEDSLLAFGQEGLPFFNDDNPYTQATYELDILSEVMTKELSFYAMTPSDSILSNHNKKETWCLSENGKQYLVFSCFGKSFSILIPKGKYQNNYWLDAKTGIKIPVTTLQTKGKTPIDFVPPNKETDWVLLIRTD